MNEKLEVIFESILNGQMAQAKKQYQRSDLGPVELLEYWEEVWKSSAVWESPISLRKVALVLQLN